MYIKLFYACTKHIVATIFCYRFTFVDSFSLFWVSNTAVIFEGNIYELAIWQAIAKHVFVPTQKLMLVAISFYI